jgi:hypothetical protein
LTLACLSSQVKYLWIRPQPVQVGRLSGGPLLGRLLASPAILERLDRDKRGRSLLSDKEKSCCKVDTRWASASSGVVPFSVSL